MKRLKRNQNKTILLALHFAIQWEQSVIEAYGEDSKEWADVVNDSKRNIEDFKEVQRRIRARSK